LALACPGSNFKFDVSASLIILDLFARFKKIYATLLPFCFLKAPCFPSKNRLQKTLKPINNSQNILLDRGKA
jgi:hypothetical protein